jgi:hypothetical protein
MMPDDANLSVGDVLTFPEWERGKALLAGPCRVIMTHGAPGTFRVAAIDPDGTVTLEKLTE